MKKNTMLEEWLKKYNNMHQQELSPIQRMAFKYVVRHLMN